MDNNSANLQNIQWYPGHMTRTRRQMAEHLKLVDAVVEILDARIPRSSRNPDIDSLTAGKPRLILLNKADYADGTATAAWINYFAKDGKKAIACDCRSGHGLGNFPDIVRSILAEQIKKWNEKGMSGRRIKLLVAGIPNVGKSSFINRMSRSDKARVADRPGVTRGSQWFTIAGGMELLDTPGVLWPKFDDHIVGLRLAFTGAVKDTVVDSESLCLDLIATLQERYPMVIEKRYKIETASLATHEILSAIGKSRGMLISGGAVDTERASVMLLDEFRGGKLGRMTLEEADH